MYGLMVCAYTVNPDFMVSTIIHSQAVHYNNAEKKITLYSHGGYWYLVISVLIVDAKLVIPRCLYESEL